LVFSLCCHKHSLAFFRLFLACVACDWIAQSFRDALLEGNYKAAKDLHATGNVNLRSPFCLDKKSESVYPIHLAILGGNLNLVRWLTSERFCPLRTQTRKGKKVLSIPLLTSKGRSPLEIALLHQRIDIVHYLVAEKKQSLFEEKNLSTDVTLANLTSVLNMIPPNYFAGKQISTVPLSAAPSLSANFFSGTERKKDIRRRPSL